MAILYVLTITDPCSVGPFPPDILASDWYANFSSVANFQSLGGGNTAGYVYSFIFDTQDDLNAWVAENALDPSLQASMDRWQAFGHVVTNKFYTLPETTGQGII